MTKLTNKLAASILDAAEKAEAGAHEIIFTAEKCGMPKQRGCTGTQAAEWLATNRPVDGLALLNRLQREAQ